MRNTSSRLALALVTIVLIHAPPAASRNVVIFVADGLRYGVVTAQTAPAMAAVQREGVDFQNSHAVYPTLTTVNAAAIATGRYPGDSGDFANFTFLGEPSLSPAFLSLTPFLEDDAVLAAADARFGGDYLGHDSILGSARKAGYQTAAIGKLGPAAIQDLQARGDGDTLVIDDATGSPDGRPVPAAVLQAIERAGLDGVAPDRGLNADPGSAIAPGVQVANVEQQDWFTRVATEVVLPRFAAAKRPFVLVFWSRDPDGTQHNQGDSLNVLQPGINGETSLRAVRNADSDLARLQAALVQLRLADDTDIVVTADHGFSTISKASATSPAAKADYPDVPHGFLPPGFLALDLGRALKLDVHEPNGIDLLPQKHPKGASAILGADVKHPDVVIGANGGSDALWLAPAKRATLARRIVSILTAQDYAAAIFVADDLGSMRGALPTSAMQMRGSARTPAPDILVTFRSGVIAGCKEKAELCTFEVSDTSLQQGQGNHGGLSRADTRNLMAVVGPDFRSGFKDPTPVGNADWAPTLATILHLRLQGPGRLEGRVLTEALREGGPPPQAQKRVLRSASATNGFTTQIEQQVVRSTVYTDQDKISSYKP